ncbi:PREDICTED: contactin-like [Priapulus caudatus]|uniref:Contactin-like n=1 Tax=Priapulus caudatus TaxID=37621 RepID=A0ABM1F0B3_PRICU|nr:PREDICTED: contactin-like [Priapulus caudatus]
MKILLLMTAVALLLIQASVTDARIELQGSKEFANERECPPGWVDFPQGFTCYKFSVAPPLDYQRSAELCQRYNSHLLSVDSKMEHDFIADWLYNNDPQKKEWYTGGRGGDPDWRWEQYLLQVPFSFKDGWLRYDEHEPRNNFGDTLIYRFKTGAWGWDRADAIYQRPFICEIRKVDLDEMDIVYRGYDYGVVVRDPERIPHGPRFIEQPDNIIYDTESVEKFVTLVCAADAYPYPTYKWYKDDSRTEIEINVLQDPRYTQTNGQLTIHMPDRDKDSGVYYCATTNDFGTVWSSRIQLEFGFLNDFTADERQPVAAYLHVGAVIECRPPAHFPDVNYYWFKNALPEFVPQGPNIFASQKGNLYFSKVVEADRAAYICLVQSSVATSGVNSVGKTSRDIRLQVRTNNAATEREPQIEVGFPAIFPGAPLLGDNVRLECFAHGDPIPRYNWTRVGGPLPPKHYKLSYDKVLVVPNVQPSDEGIYVCEASNTKGKKEERVLLTIASRPIYTLPLEDLHVDVGSTVTMTCEAFGRPEVSYRWLRNGQEMNPATVTDTRFSFDRVGTLVTLTVTGVTPRDSGMYQCESRNVHGVRYSSAQLRVLALAPTFAKHPLPNSLFGAVKGNLTISCAPEAAPSPVYTWKQNGQSFADDGRRRILPDGTLIVTDVRRSDEGQYECEAENALGKSSSRANVTVLPAAIISRAPENARVQVGQNHMFECEASIDSLLDLAYVWLHNGIPLDLEHDLHYETRITNRPPGYLLIKNTTFSQAGEYTCVVKTTIDEIGQSARLFVEGPPSAPSGVRASGVTQTSVTLQWSTGGDGGHAITGYAIEASDNYTDSWFIVKEIAVREDEQRPDTDIVTTIVDNLSPWNTYQCRVRAVNAIGVSVPSDESSSFFTLPAAPNVAPSNIGGGGGKIGDLKITWTPLTKDLWNAPGIGYIVHWRKLGVLSDFEKKRFAEQRGQYVHRVGEENFYLEYEVRVQAFNEIGLGPMSNVTMILSAENTPVVTPIDMQATPYNSTAIEVYWTRLDDTRENMRGRLHGVRIEYWMKGSPEDDYVTAIFPNASSHAVIIGLQPNTHYLVRVMAYNSAGNGEKSQAMQSYTFKASPLTAPTDVRVATLNDENRMRVTWNGITTGPDEESLEGYKIRIMQAHEIDPTKNFDYIVGQTNSYILTDLQSGVAFRLRVLGYSNGGDGKQSSAVLFQITDQQYGHAGYRRSGARALAGSSLLFCTVFLSAVLCC